MVSASVLAENKPWVVSADALHYLRPVSREDHTCPVHHLSFSLVCLSSLGVPIQLKYLSVVCKNNTDDQDRSLEKSIDTGAPSPIFIEVTKTPGKKVKNYIHIQTHKSVCCGTIQNFSKHPKLFGYQSLKPFFFCL